MSQTVIGFFDDHSEAQRAIEKLTSIGVSRQNIDLSKGGSDSRSTSSNASGSTHVNPVSGSERDENSVSKTDDNRTVDSEGRNTNVFTDFFNNLFGGNNDKDSKHFSGLAARSGAIVTVHAQSKEEAERAADVLDDCGAVDVDEKGSDHGSSNNSHSNPLDINLGGTTGNSGSGSRMRSRIFDGRIDEDRRLRDLDSNSGTGFGTSNSDSRNI